MSTVGERLVTILAGFSLAAVAQAAEPVRYVESGLLDEMTLYVEAPPAASQVVIRKFDPSKADLGTGAEGGKEARVEAVKTIQASGPELLASSLSKKLAALGTFKSVRMDDGSPAPADALVIEGHFSKIDPGSKAKRYWVGFGAGHSGTEVEGTVKDAAGNVLAKFKQERIAVMGAFGGDYVAKMTADCRDIGEDLAVFLDAWATGKPLKKEKKGKKGE
jgi:hypothetical protein